MKIKITFGGPVIIASLFNNKTANDFVKLLPLEFIMYDLFDREKYGNIPKALCTDGKRQNTFGVGDIGYWSPGTDIAIYYNDDEGEISSPGIIVIGKIDEGIEALTNHTSVSVRIEQMNVLQALFSNN